MRNLTGFARSGRAGRAQCDTKKLTKESPQTAVSAGMYTHSAMHM